MDAKRVHHGWVVVVIGALAVAAFVVGAGLIVWLATGWPEASVPAPALLGALAAHEPELTAEGDRMLHDAGVDHRSPDGPCPPATAPARTDQAAGQWRTALDDLGIVSRHVEFCTAVFTIEGEAGYGAERPQALLYRGTALYGDDPSCRGRSGSTPVAVSLGDDWHLGFTIDC